MADEFEGVLAEIHGEMHAVRGELAKLRMSELVTSTPSAIPRCGCTSGPEADGLAAAARVL
jgi:hypothetical protein